MFGSPSPENTSRFELLPPPPLSLDDEQLHRQRSQSGGICRAIIGVKKKTVPVGETRTPEGCWE